MGCFICKATAPLETANQTVSTSSKPTDNPPLELDSPFEAQVLEDGRSLQHRSEIHANFNDGEGEWDECDTVFVLDDVDATQTLDALQDAVTDTHSSSIVEKAFQNSLSGSKTPRSENPVEDQQTSTREVQETSLLRIEKIKGCMFVNQYLIVKYLGRGACGKVFLCLNVLDFKLYAMKSVRKADLESSRARDHCRNLMDDLKREILIMKKMKHSNIVTLSEVIDDPTGSKLLLVMEYLEGGPIMSRESLDKCERLPESLVFRYFREMVQALDYLHSQHVVHGDLKPENVLVSANGQVKLSDFGCSKVIVSGNEYLERCNGTPAFLAPEMMKPNTRYRGTPTDVYAMGVCLYTLLFGRIPFRASNLYQLFQVVQNENVNFPEDVRISDSLKDLVMKLLIKNPKERIKLSEICRHPWVTNNGQEPLPRSSEQSKAEAKTPTNHNSVNLQEIISNLARESVHERVYNEGELLLKQGDPGRSLLVIIRGECKVLLSCNAPSDASRRHRRNHADSTADPLMNSSDSASSVTVGEAERKAKKNLLEASLKAQEFVQKQSRDDSAILIGYRGAGDVLGEMGVFTREGRRMASVRASSKVLVKIITKEQVLHYLSRFPEARQSLRELVWKRESENVIVEGLFQLASIQKHLASTYEQINNALAKS